MYYNKIKNLPYLWKILYQHPFGVAARVEITKYELRRK